MRIIGVDPGFGRVGWGIIEGVGQDWTHLAHGCIGTDSNKEFVERLLQIEGDLRLIIEKYQPDKSAVEELFFNTNTTTAIKVAQARGVLLLTLAHANLSVVELTPLQIKQSITGYGRAEKGQVQKMIQLQLKLKDIPKPDDAADALATALSCGLMSAFLDKSKN